MTADRIRGVVGVFGAPRFHVGIGDVPAAAAARRMGMDEKGFAVALPNLIARGFPKPDPDTGNFDLDAIDAWRRARHAHLFNPVTTFAARDASQVVEDRIAAMRGNNGG